MTDWPSRSRLKQLMHEIHGRLLWPLAPTARSGSLLGCACLLTLAFLGCSLGEDRASADASTITILYPVDERGLGPAWEMPSKLLVFLPLAVEDENGELEGRLARSWEHSSDYRTWTVHLRTDVRWHDGVPVTAADIEFTLGLLSSPGVARVDSKSFNLTVLDDSTYTIAYHSSGGYGAGWPLDTYATFYPKHLLEGLDSKEFTSWEFWEHPVGNGPYRYVRHIPQTMIELEANPDHFRGKPRIERVVLKFGQSSVAELLSGNVDATSINRADVPKLADDPRFQLYHEISPWNSTVIVWNQRHPLFRDPRVRRALTLAIDRRELYGVLNLPEDLPILDGFLTQDQLRRGDLPDPLLYDPEQAKQLLEEVGWRDTGGGGVRRWNGEEFRFEAIVAPLGTGEEEAAVYVQAALRRVGVHMNLQILDLSVGRRRVRAGEFEAAIATLHSPALSGWFDHLALFGPSRGEQDRKAAQLISRIRAAMGDEEVDRNLRELLQIFRTEVPMTVLHPMVSTTAAHRRVRGLSSNLYRSHPVWLMDELRLEDEP